jgi:hypothetical protein
MHKYQNGLDMSPPFDVGQLGQRSGFIQVLLRLCCSVAHKLYVLDAEPCESLLADLLPCWQEST